MAEGISKEEEKREGEKDVLHIDAKFATNGQITSNFTAKNIQFSIKDFFSKCDQIRRKLRM